MHDFPHVYGVTATMSPDDNVRLSCPGLQPLASAPPTEFGGPGKLWSPETLLVAAVADCFALSFRAIAKGSRFEWQALQSQVECTLDHLESGIRFTAFTVRATLTIAPGSDEMRARKLLEKAEQACLITKSLKAASTLTITLRRS